MKYLYRILRLFFCPHKYAILQSLEITKICKDGTKSVIGNDIIIQCKYCGKLKNFKQRVY